MAIRVELGYHDASSAMDSAGNYTSRKVPYIVFGAASENEALSAVRNTADQSLNGLVLDEIEIDEEIDPSTFKITVNYAVPGPGVSYDPESDPEPVFAFDTGGATTHISTSLATVGKYPDDAPDFKQCVEVDSDGTVNGLDINIPCMNFTETHYLSNSKITTSYKRTLASLTGKVNDSSFKGFNAGEVMFMGASGSRRGKHANDKWEITFKFAVQMNKSNFKVGDITVQDKKGWDYSWVKFKSTTETASDGTEFMIKKPAAVYVEKVAEREDFSQLEIGT